jgi:hypothetical protein
MTTSALQADTKLLDRRQLLKLAAASVLLISACTEVKDEPESDRAISELASVLDEMASNDQQQTLIGIAERIETQARELVAEHQAFIADFNRLLNDRDATETDLGQLINAYADRRTFLRNNLLRLQDQLHTSLSPEEWAEVVKVLNRAGKSVSGYTLQKD